MSMVEKIDTYRAAHNGELPNDKDLSEMIRVQFHEYIEALIKATQSNCIDAFMVAAAHRKIYEALYYALDPEDKINCDNLGKIAGTITVIKK